MDFWDDAWESQAIGDPLYSVYSRAVGGGLYPLKSQILP